MSRCICGDGPRILDVAGTSNEFIGRGQALFTLSGLSVFYFNMHTSYQLTSHNKVCVAFKRLHFNQTALKQTNMWQLCNRSYSKRILHLKTFGTSVRAKTITIHSLSSGRINFEMPTSAHYLSRHRIMSADNPTLNNWSTAPIAQRINQSPITRCLRNESPAIARFWGNFPFFLSNNRRYNIAYCFIVIERSL